jgi:hypothetical protein
MIDSKRGVFGFVCCLASPKFRVFQQPARLEERLRRVEPLPKERPRQAWGPRRGSPLPYGSLFGAARRPEFRLSRRATFTLLNGDTAAGRPALSAFFRGAHSAFGLRANAEPGTADDHTDTRRRGRF